MKKNKVFLRIFNIRPKPRGQSLVELALVLSLLLFMMLAIVEYGFLLNRYLNLLDASREAARYGATTSPFDDAGNLDMNFFVRPNTLQPPSYPANPPGLADFTEDFMNPVVLNPTNGDDIVISFFSVSGTTVTRFPDSDGFSRYGNHASALSNAQVSARLEGGAPPSGVLLVEIFYNYPQVLNLPIFTSFIPNPIPVYTYAIMPLSAAEPTEIP